MIDQMADHSIDWLIDWLIGRHVRLIGLIELIVCWLIDWLVCILSYLQVNQSSHIIHQQQEVFKPAELEYLMGLVGIFKKLFQPNRDRLQKYAWR